MEMRNILKLEQLGLLLLFITVYFHFYPGTWGLFLGLFFVPDISFAMYLISARVGAIAYNILHHKGVMAIVVILGLYMQDDLIIKIGLIFLAHSSFDRVLGYGLKYPDDFGHTHLGWIGKKVKSEE
jgi:hypothetical protein